MINKEIGGYFELELPKRIHYHQAHMKLATGRQCFEYILRAKKYNKVYLPYYICEAMFEPLHKMKVEYEFYTIDKDLNPLFTKGLADGEVLLYVNYYGLKDNAIINLSKKYPNLIVDNTQAFFAKPLNGIDTFYSARKFFGVPDGAYLYTDTLIEEEFPVFNPMNNMKYLLGRLTKTAGDYYKDYQEAEASLSGMEIHMMSILSDKILSSLDYKEVRKDRMKNFRILHQALGGINKLNLPFPDSEVVPMIYPFYYPAKDYRQKLINAKIYIARYWKNVEELVKKDSVEYLLVDKLLCLPIDQRYGKNEMDILIKNLLTD